MDNTSFELVKELALRLFRPFLLWLFRESVFSLRDACVSENIELCEVLKGNGFHPALCNHPSILFEDKTVQNAALTLCNAKVSFLKKCIRTGLLKDEKGHKLMRGLGIQPYFEVGIDSWFVEKYSPIKPYSIPDKWGTKARIVVYSVLTGDYDFVNEILYKEPGVDYLLFTNNAFLTSKTWEVIHIKSELDDVLLSREIKMLPYLYLDEKYEISIYIDANAVIYGELSQLSRYLEEEKAFAVSRHSVRKTVREEIDECAKLGKVDGEKAKVQYDRYLYEGFVDEDTLLECGLLVRKHKDRELQLLMQNWFNEFRNGIRRDQLSLPPCISRLGYKDYVIMDGSVWHNQFNRLVSHKKR